MNITHDRVHLSPFSPASLKRDKVFLQVAVRGDCFHRPTFATVYCHTGQHFDVALENFFLDLADRTFTKVCDEGIRSRAFLARSHASHTLWTRVHAPVSHASIETMCL